MKTIVKNQDEVEHNNNINLTSRQIRKKVGEAWAFLENPKYEKGVLTTANLLYYNVDKKKVLEHSGKYEKGHFALRFFGKIDTKQIYIL